MEKQLKPETLAEIDGLIPRFPERRSALLMVLHAVQEDLGFISQEAIEWIAQKLGLQPVEVLEAVTFYPMFRRAAIGKMHVKVCRTAACALRGSYAVYDTLRKRLGCENGTYTSPDGRFTVEFVECMANCNHAPSIMVNDDLHNDITPDKADAFAQKLLDETR